MCKQSLAGRHCVFLCACIAFSPCATSQRLAKLLQDRADSAASAAGPSESSYGAAASSSTGLCQIANDAPNDDIPAEGNRPMMMPEKQPKVTLSVCAFVGCADPTVQHDSMPLSCIMLNCRYLVMHGTCPHYQVVYIKTFNFFHRLSRRNRVWKLLQGALRRWSAPANSVNTHICQLLILSWQQGGLTALCCYCS